MGFSATKRRIPLATSSRQPHFTIWRMQMHGTECHMLLCGSWSHSSRGVCSEGAEHGVLKLIKVRRIPTLQQCSSLSHCASIHGGNANVKKILHRMENSCVIVHIKCISHQVLLLLLRDVNRIHFGCSTAALCSIWDWLIKLWPSYNYFLQETATP